MPVKFDPTVPALLKKTQKWFAMIITNPIQKDSSIQPISPNGQPIEKEAKKYIVPSPTLQPYQRIQIYNQQYWWRLLTNLQEAYPLVTRLFGFSNFNNEIAFPYLVKYPPDDWSLNSLGKNLPKWICEDYHASDKQLIYDTATIDLAFTENFIAKHYPHINLSAADGGDVASLLKIKLRLQPYVSLFEFDCDLFAFREKLIKEDGDYWIDHDFPKLVRDRKYLFVFYRTVNNFISWNEISPGEFYLLRLFQKGISIDGACKTLEKADPIIVEEASQHLQKWIQAWVVRKWLFVNEKKGIS